MVTRNELRKEIRDGIGRLRIQRIGLIRRACIALAKAREERFARRAFELDCRESDDAPIPIRKSRFGVFRPDQIDEAFELGEEAA